MNAIGNNTNAPQRQPNPAAVKTSSPAQTVRAEDPSSILRRVRRDIVLLGAGNIGLIVAQFCFRSILIALLVPSAYGRLSLILSVYNTVWIIGASGLPSSAARYIALITPGDDFPIIRSAVRAGIWPTVVASTVVATVSSAVLESPLAFLFGAIGLSSLVYSLIAMGILRGRGRIGMAASVMPIAGVVEVAVLVLIWRSGIGVTPLSAFGVFCLGNFVGLVIGVFWVIRTAPRRMPSNTHHENAAGAVPTSRHLLGFSMWLGAATMGMTILPLIVRLGAAIDSYTVVAIVDVALILFTLPQRMGAVLVTAVVPHASRAVHKDDVNLTISRREHFIVIVPFMLAAIIVGFTPIVEWLFDSIGRPEYASSAEYLALALLAGPARVLYGIVEGVLVAHGEGRFLAFTALSITLLASAVILVIAALGNMKMAFAVFVLATWAVYLWGLQRIRRLNVERPSTHNAFASSVSP